MGFRTADILTVLFHHFFFNLRNLYLFDIYVLSSLVFPGLTFGAPLDKNIEIVLFISLWAYITIFKVKKQDKDYKHRDLNDYKARAWRLFIIEIVYTTISMILFAGWMMSQRIKFIHVRYQSTISQ